MKIGFYNIQGGTGKTTIAANMAYYLSDRIKTVYLDCDIYGGTGALLFGLEDNPNTLNAYLTEKCDFNDIIHEYKNLSVVVCDTTPNAFDTDTDQKKFLEVIKTLEKDYDVIILDLPPNITEGNILFSSESVLKKMIVVAEDSIPGIANTLKTIELLNALNLEIMGIIVNKDRNIVDFEGILNEDDILAILPYDKKVEYQWLEGVPIIEKRSSFGKELTFLADELSETYIEKDLATLRALKIAKEFRSSIIGGNDEADDNNDNENNFKF
ncbi:MinD/ParA family protein [Methanothermococcus sp.]|uniref:MinD/ParA family ATP-binding protein n=1 Tax=Methanothermococcus sp. TaxID=2614238 RepID=UPI0025E21421|nr:MinD/ParA family protein [Methanothermococcus sp.]